MKKLLNQGFNAGYIANSDNGLNYIYLEQYGTMWESMAAAKSQLNGRYTQEIWVLHIENENNDLSENNSLEPIPEHTMPVEEVTYDMIQASQLDQDQGANWKAPPKTSYWRRLISISTKCGMPKRRNFMRKPLGNGKQQQFSFDIVQSELVMPTTLTPIWKKPTIGITCCMNNTKRKCPPTISLNLPTP